MSKIVIAGTVDVSPEKRDQALLDAKPLIDAALAEPGCRAYAWTRDPYDEGRIHVFEEWESEETLREHFKAPSYLDMRTHLGSVGLRGAETRKYRIEIDEPVYDESFTPRADFFTA